MNKNLKVERRVINDRMVWFREEAKATFWDSHWEGTISDDYYAPFLNGELSIYKSVFLKYLTKKDRILEAGCGLGQYVMGLRAHGYNAEGVDFAEKTIKQINERYPDLPIRNGDVTKLDVPDDYYGGYISLGVVEHTEAGPEPFFQEAARVVKKGGILIFTVPRFSPLRRLKFRLGLITDKPSQLPFYQYGFTESEFRQLLEKCPFEIVEILPSSGIKGVRDEWGFFKRWFDASKKGYRHAIIIRLFRYLPFLEKLSGHMILAVVRRT